MKQKKIANFANGSPAVKHFCFKDVLICIGPNLIESLSKRLSTKISSEFLAGSWFSSPSMFAVKHFFLLSTLTGAVIYRLIHIYSIVLDKFLRNRLYRVYTRTGCVSYLRTELKKRSPPIQQLSLLCKLHQN